jgi:hypothetical protein
MDTIRATFRKSVFMGPGLAGACPALDAGARPGTTALISIHSSSVAITGTWSEGRRQARAPLATVIAETRSPSSGLTQM